LPPGVEVPTTIGTSSGATHILGGLSGVIAASWLNAMTSLK
jgi:hypothetical protein